MQLFLANFWKGSSCPSLHPDNCRAYDGRTALMAAAGGNKLPVMQYLIEKSADVNARCMDGATALHGAAAGGHSQAVAMLIVRAKE